MSEDKTNLLRSLRLDPAEVMAEGRRRHWRLPVTLVLLFAALAAWAALSQLRHVEPTAALAEPPPAKIAAVASTPVPAPAPAAETTVAPPLAPPAVGGLVASGYVVARRKATVAAEITGKIIEVGVEEGMAVERGQELARLDSSLAEVDLVAAKAKVLAAKAAIESAGADLKDARRIFERTRNLQASDYASQADLTRNEARADVLKAQLAKAEADLAVADSEVRRAQETIDKHHIRAPFSGVVVDRSAQMGEIISPLSAGGGFTRTGVCTIVDMDSLEIEVDVNETFIHRVVPKQKVKAVLDAYPDWTIPAEVIAVVPTANRDKATIKVRIALLAKDPRILPDMAAKVTFMVPGEKGGRG